MKIISEVTRRGQSEDKKEGDGAWETGKRSDLTFFSFVYSFPSRTLSVSRFQK